VTQSMLREIFNSRTGLFDKSRSYPAMLLKAALAVTVSSTNRVFPGGWIKSNRVLNEVKSDSGLIYKMGYAEKVPYHHKLLSVIHNTVVTMPDSKLKISNQGGKETPKYTFLEFRAGTVLSAPAINHLSGESMDLQVKREPLSVRSAATLENYSDSKYHKTVNALNRSYALLITANKGNSKTKPIHYQIARNEFLHLCAKVPIKSGDGAEHQTLSQLPEPVYEYCKKTFKFRNSEKRILEDNAMDIAPTVEDPLPPKKKGKGIRDSGIVEVPAEFVRPGRTRSQSRAVTPGTDGREHWE
jgi:hypothetical protein